MTETFHPRFPRPPPAEPVQRRKGPPEWQDPAATLEQEVSGNSRERTEDVSFLGKKAQGEALQNVINKLFDESNLRDLHLKHYPQVYGAVQEEDDPLGCSWKNV